MMRTAVGLLAVAAVCSAFSTYRLRIPSGLGVPGVSAVGHENKVGGGRPTQFGKDFERLGGRWTKALCELDSDGDGATNGQELGDPCCEWRVGLPTRPNPTSPGHANEFSADELAAMQCTPSGPPIPLAQQRVAPALVPDANAGSDPRDL
uniref:Secreted protein n=1 Tax=Achlya hypogyna TaxID=1202772 RepID=A0A0A7CMK6_ACHHY|nr:secreted protein [Achlya hypogyna]